MRKIPCRIKESSIKKSMKDWLDSEGIFWSMVAGGAYSKEGDPDLILCVDGKFVAVEGKTETGEQRNLQRTRMRQIRESGGIYVVARNLDDLKILIWEIRHGNLEDAQE